jgi:hypothetical protein
MSTKKAWSNVDVNKMVPIDKHERDMGDDIRHTDAIPVPATYTTGDGKTVKVGISFGDFSQDARDQGPYIRLQLLAGRYKIVNFRFKERGDNFIDSNRSDHLIYHRVRGCRQEIGACYIKYLFLDEHTTIGKVLAALERIDLTIEVIE